VKRVKSERGEKEGEKTGGTHTRITPEDKKWSQRMGRKEQAKEGERGRGGLESGVKDEDKSKLRA
jgi:hypothetical protein